uniref:Uncharacterized protein n=1 Tax=Oryza barthii TaxID=65489 RepID=A0A0D3G814_9ORYZ
MAARRDGSAVVKAVGGGDGEAMAAVRRMEATAMRPSNPLTQAVWSRRQRRSCCEGVCPLAVAACRRKMATVDERVRGRGDPFFSLTLSLSNPTTWMDVKHGEGWDSSSMASRRRGVGAVAARRRGLDGGSAELACTF